MARDILINTDLYRTSPVISPGLENIITYTNITYSLYFYLKKSFNQECFVVSGMIDIWNQSLGLNSRQSMICLNDMFPARIRIASSQIVTG